MAMTEVAVEFGIMKIGADPGVGNLVPCRTEHFVQRTMGVSRSLAGSQSGVQREMAIWSYTCSRADSLKEKFVLQASADDGTYGCGHIAEEIVTKIERNHGFRLVV